MEETKLYYLLQSGFVTRDTGRLALHVGKSPTMVDRITPKPQIAKASEYYYDQRVTELFEEWRGSTALLQSMEFRERLLIEAIRVFHRTSETMAQWFLDQLQATTSSYLHRRFILETAAFVYNQTPRPVQVLSYVPMLSPKKPSIDSKPAAEAVPELRKIQLSGYMTRDDDLLVSWTRTPQRLADMLSTLALIFAKHGDTVR